MHILKEKVFKIWMPLLNSLSKILKIAQRCELNRYCFFEHDHGLQL